MLENYLWNSSFLVTLPVEPATFAALLRSNSLTHSFKDHADIIS